jgi:hypothetical protein
MKTTFEISDELCRQPKRKATNEGITIRQVVESALRFYLGKQTRRKVTSLTGKQNEAEYYPAAGTPCFDLMDCRQRRKNQQKAFSQGGPAVKRRFPVVAVSFARL